MHRHYAPLWIAFLCLWSRMTQAEEAADRHAATRRSVESAVNWLQEKGENWKESRQCASCHHVPLMTWALHEAQRHNFDVDEELLNTCTDWFFAENDPAKVFHKPSFEEEEYSNPLSLASVYTLLSESNDPREPSYRTGVTRIMKSIAESQESDGSWKPFFGRAPIMASRESLALLLTNVTSWPNQPAELQAIIAEPRRKAISWLKAHQEENETHVLALRLWMLSASGDHPAEAAALAETLKGRQRDDGGWNQIESRASDAYATGHVLYAFQVAGFDSNSDAIRRGVDFLLKNQTKEGSWVMIPRENRPIFVFAMSALTLKPVAIGTEPPPSTTGRNVEPISFSATAWATVALSRTLP